jgi:hypothetical protein
MVYVVVAGSMAMIAESWCFEHYTNVGSEKTFRRVADGLPRF